MRLPVPRFVLTPVVVVLLLAACGDDQDPALSPSDGTTTTTSAAPVEGDTVELEADLTGAAEVPGPGDDAGSGEADITIDPATGEICFDVDPDDIESSQAAHIHEGGADEAGPVVVDLGDPNDDGEFEGCTTVEADLAGDIAENPGDYYVNVHNEAFPDGAVRGQLESS
jgi:hypothetical protein